MRLAYGVALGGVAIRRRSIARTESGRDRWNTLPTVEYIERTTIVRRKWNWIACTSFMLAASSANAQVESVPTRNEDNVVVAAHNIQFMGESEHDHAKLASVIQYFDVCGILELKGERAILELL